VAGRRRVAPDPGGEPPVGAARAAPTGTHQPAGSRLPAAPPTRFATRGQPVALAAVERMLDGGAPQALLLVGPAAIGKTTLALDLAAGLLCAAEEGVARPCRACRACRLVAGGTHQDLHRLAPEGAGRQVRIGDPSDPDPGTVRHLIHEMARLPVEGRHRVAVIEGAHRMNEDAQNALLKTLEEPPAGATLILCADEPERLLPTVRSRVATLRLGPLGIRAIEGLLGERGIDPPRAARLARLAGGRPGLALAYAAAPQAVDAREEISRTLLDLIPENRSRRLAIGRELLARAADLASLRVEPGAAGVQASAGLPALAGESGALRAAPSAAALPAAAPPADGEAEAVKPGRSSPAERRLAARALLETWAAVARDLAVVAAGGRGRSVDLALVDDLEAAAARIPVGAAPAFLARLARAARLLEANVNPELIVDVLVLAWPRAA
jgi:DNA polymerase-3 subunit delta'